MGLVTATAVIPSAAPKVVSSTHPRSPAQATSPLTPLRYSPRVSRATRAPLPRAARPARHAATVRPLRASAVPDAALVALVAVMPSPPSSPAPSGDAAPSVGTGPVIPSDGSTGARIIAEARKYLGVPYVSNGATPDGFDCSGYTMWVYSHVGVAELPHNGEAQREIFHQIPQSAARPGDLIFYLDGNYAYHVAIYAGYGMQYAAPAPGQNVKLEPIWSSDITFGTDWH
ncbi:MAG TPA: NlpC/P60 family protein [Jatrophihabitantaceae bacterium]|jgi:cell wall-associated NlpC family hydrolase